MKSSTLRRSNLSREKIAVLEELAKTKRLNEEESNVYVRTGKSKEKELDVLWQNFRVNQKSDKSPGVYLITGFIAGAVAMLIMTTLLSVSVRTTETDNTDFTAPRAKKEKPRLTFIPADRKAQTAPVVASSEAYTVQNGDTLESIIIRFYGGFSMDRVEKIKQANSLANPNNLSIGQKLIIPLE